MLRARAIHGSHSPHPREWYFVKRAPDRRNAVVLAHGGQRVFHPVSALNLADDFVLDMHAAETALGYEPVVRYDQGVVDEVEWLVTSTAADDWHNVVRDHAHLDPFFDYEAEDLFLRTLGSA